MNALGIIAVHPIGTKMRLKDDDPGTIREVYGYELLGDTENILFLDGCRLNMKRLDLIKEVLSS